MGFFFFFWFKKFTLLFFYIAGPKVLLMLNCGTSQDISALEGVISCVLEGLARTLVQARTGPQVCLLGVLCGS